jgi:hypothetical protein
MSPTSYHCSTPQYIIISICQLTVPGYEPNDPPTGGSTPQYILISICQLTVPGDAPNDPPAGGSTPQCGCKVNTTILIAKQIYILF